MTEMPWIRWLDLDTATEPDGTLTVTLPRPKAEHLNHNEAINAAVAYGVAEVAGAGAAVLGLLDLLDTTYTAVESATIRYTAPANAGVVATARLDPLLRQSARDAAVRREAVQLQVGVSLADLDGRPTGTCQLTMALRPKKSAPPEHRPANGPRDDLEP